MYRTLAIIYCTVHTPHVAGVACQINIHYNFTKYVANMMEKLIWIYPPIYALKTAPIHQYAGQMAKIIHYYQMFLVSTWKTTGFIGKNPTNMKIVASWTCGVLMSRGKDSLPQSSNTSGSCTDILSLTHTTYHTHTQVRTSYDLMG